MLITQHHFNQEIAQSVSLSQKTERNYTLNVFAKLQVTNRAEAILRARDAGFGQQLGPRETRYRKQNQHRFS